MKLINKVGAVALSTAMMIPALVVDLKIGVITSLSGPISAIEIP